MNPQNPPSEVDLTRPGVFAPRIAPPRPRPNSSSPGPRGASDRSSSSSTFRPASEQSSRTILPFSAVTGVTPPPKNLGVRAKDREDGRSLLNSASTAASSTSYCDDWTGGGLLPPSTGLAGASAGQWVSFGGFSRQHGNSRISRRGRCSRNIATREVEDVATRKIGTARADQSSKERTRAGSVCVPRSSTRQRIFTQRSHGLVGALNHSSRPRNCFLLHRRRRLFGSAI